MLFKSGTSTLQMPKVCLTQQRTLSRLVISVLGSRMFLALSGMLLRVLGSMRLLRSLGILGMIFWTQAVGQTRNGPLRYARHTIGSFTSLWNLHPRISHLRVLWLWRDGKIGQSASISSRVRETFCLVGICLILQTSSLQRSQKVHFRSGNR